MFGLLIFSVVSFYWTTQVLAYLVRMAAGAYFTSAYLASSPSHPLWNPPQSFKSALGRAASTSFGTVAFASLLSGSKHLSSNPLSHAARTLDALDQAQLGALTTVVQSQGLSHAIHHTLAFSTKRALSDTAATDAMMAVGTKLTCAAGRGAACATFAVAPKMLGISFREVYRDLGTTLLLAFMAPWTIFGNLEGCCPAEQWRVCGGRSGWGQGGETSGVAIV